MISQKQCFEWLRKRKLHFLWPFFFYYETSLTTDDTVFQTITVFRFGFRKYEVWRFNRIQDYKDFQRNKNKVLADSDYNCVKLYKLFEANHANLVMKTKDWNSTYIFRSP